MKRGGVAHRSNLTPDLKRHLGSANKAFLDGDYDQSVELLQEIIKQSPRASEPYHTMAMIYEELEDTNKSLLFYMVAAHLRPSDGALWKRIAELSRASDMLDQCTYCLRMAVRADHSDADSLRELAEIFIDSGKTLKVHLAFLMIFAYWIGTWIHD